MKPCMMRGCIALAYELAPGLATLYCAAHRAAVVAQPVPTTPPLPGLVVERGEQARMTLDARAVNPPALEVT